MERGLVLALYDEYADSVYRVALGYLRTPCDAQDAVQSVFCKLLERELTVYPGRERAFLTKLTINHCKNQLAAAKRRAPAALDELDEARARLVTDDCSLFELTGRPVELVQGDYANIKITTREDLPRAENGGKKMRIGHGYDVHRLVEGRKLILGGVEVPYEKGLLGHSDADVLAHAVMDAVLGAAALGDIGQHFPDTAEEYAGADSLVLARRVAEIVAAQGWRIENIDATILCQRPKLAPYIPVMREKLAAAFGLPVEAVSVKATTEEHLGFTGEGLGIAAHAVALIEAV